MQVHGPLMVGGGGLIPPAGIGMGPVIHPLLTPIGSDQPDRSRLRSRGLGVERGGAQQVLVAGGVTSDDGQLQAVHKGKVSL